MTANPLRTRRQEAQSDIPDERIARLRYWVDKGNAYLVGIGRYDLHWYIHDGQVRIGYRLDHIG